MFIKHQCKKVAWFAGRTLHNDEPQIEPVNIPSLQPPPTPTASIHDNGLGDVVDTDRELASGTEQEVIKEVDTQEVQLENQNGKADGGDDVANTAFEQNNSVPIDTAQITAQSSDSHVGRSVEAAELMVDTTEDEVISMSSRNSRRVRFSDHVVDLEETYIEEGKDYEADNEQEENEVDTVDILGSDKPQVFITEESELIMAESNVTDADKVVSFQTTAKTDEQKILEKCDVESCEKTANVQEPYITVNISSTARYGEV